MYRQGRGGVLFPCVLNSRSSSPGKSPKCGHYFVFLDKTLNSYSAFLYIQLGVNGYCKI